MEKNLSLSTTLTLRRSLKKEEMHLPKITFQSSVSAIEFIFMRSQVSLSWSASPLEV